MKLTPWYVNNKCLLLIQCKPTELEFAGQIVDDLTNLSLFDGSFVIDESLDLEIGEAV